MQTISVDLSHELKTVELHIFADEHIGDPNCDLKRLKERIDYVANKRNAFCVLNGDIVDCATKTSVGDVYSSAMNPMRQYEKAVELFSPVRKKILAVVQGNHEARIWRYEGIDISKLMAREFGIEDRYSCGAAMIFLRFGIANGNHGARTLNGKPRLDTFTIFLVHGTGGARKEGAKAIRLADLAAIADADCYIHGHTHLPMVMRETYFRTDKCHHTVPPVDRLFVNGASNCDYGGYGEAKEYKPQSKKMPVIYLYAGRLDDRAEAIL